MLGQVSGEPDSLLRVEVFGNADSKAGEAEQYLGEVMVATDAKGQAQFEYVLPQADGLQAFTATVTRSDGATSELSKALAR
ncbi:hypothetical protein [Pseudomonas palmensis]|uniref:hypothetical protein n=1 Tax=Pseudomonas palmensis TaxID=2815362 RepID=UPI003CF1E1A4